MNIEIRRRYTNEIIICGEYESIKDCLEKNRGAYLEDANLRGAYLGGANLRGANLRDAYLGGANLEDANLRGANLRDAYLGGANLRDAYLGGANLRDAYLGGAKNYVNNHDFWAEIIHRQKLKTFTEKEWAIIGQVYIHRLCWETILKQYGKKIMPIFKKLSKAGFSEWEEVYQKKLE